MARLVGTWWGYLTQCLNFRPKYRFAKITKRSGKEYLDWTGSVREDVEVDVYGYKLVGSKGKPYAYDDWFYLPTVKVGHEKGYFRIYHGRKELWLDGWMDLYPWDGKTPLTVRENYGHN